jgi:hypothetical protein
MPAKGQENAVQTSIFLEPLLGPVAVASASVALHRQNLAIMPAKILSDSALACRQFPALNWSLK